MDETLIKAVCENTGLSSERVQQIIKGWVMETGRSPQGLSLEDLREVLVVVVQNLFTEVLSGDHEFLSLSDSVSRP